MKLSDKDIERAKKFAQKIRDYFKQPKWLKKKERNGKL